MAYPEDSAFRASTLRLLAGTWAKLPQGIERARAWGADWFDHSEPFVLNEGGESVAHVGVMEIPAVIEGHAVTLAGIHAVCTRVDRRGRGHLHETMRRALAWVDGRYEGAVLWANDPAIYGRYGFVARAEAAFRAPLGGLGGGGGPRLLSLEDGGDVRLLRACLAARAPVSTSCGSRDPGWLALINLGLWAAAPSIALAEEIGAVLIYEVRDRALRLYDVIAGSMPTLDGIRRCLGSGFDSIEVFFSPEALHARELEAAPTPLVDRLMVRGPVFTRDAPMAFSPLSRC